MNYKKEIETPVLLACAIEDSTDIFGISGVFEHPKPPLGTPLLVYTFRNVCTAIQRTVFSAPVCCLLNYLSAPLLIFAKET